MEIFVNYFANCPSVAVLLVAMVPALESKVAIPLGVSSQIWGNETLSLFSSFIMAFIGSMLPALFIIWIVRIVKKKTSGFVHDMFVMKIQTRFQKKFNELAKKNTTFKKCVLIAMFVSVPLPLTGVYSGSIIAGFTNLNIWQSFLSIFVGELFSCLIVVLLCTVFENSTFYILLISLILVALFLLVNVITGLLKKARKTKQLK